MCRAARRCWLGSFGDSRCRAARRCGLGSFRRIRCVARRDGAGWVRFVGYGVSRGATVRVGFVSQAGHHASRFLKVIPRRIRVERTGSAVILIIVKRRGTRPAKRACQRPRKIGEKSVSVQFEKNRCQFNFTGVVLALEENREDRCQLVFSDRKSLIASKNELTPIFLAGVLPQVQSAVEAQGLKVAPCALKPFQW